MKIAIISPILLVFCRGFALAIIENPIKAHPIYCGTANQDVAIPNELMNALINKEMTW